MFQYIVEDKGILRRVYPSSNLFPLSFEGEGDTGGEVDENPLSPP